MSDSKPVNDGEKEVILPAAWIGLIAQCLPAADVRELSAQAEATIKQKIMQRVGSGIGSSPINGEVISILRESAWITLSKKLQVKLLHDDGITISWLLKMLPGGRLQPHEHADGAEECMVLEGELSINGVKFKGGDYQIAHPGSVHFEVATEVGAMLFLKSPASRKKDLMLA
jgi:anti-sigma factor ChrR (cupin superfamily)